MHFPSLFSKGLEPKYRYGYHLLTENVKEHRSYYRNGWFLLHR